MKPLFTGDYIGALKQRGAKARVTERFQLIGLEIAVTLQDLAHKALYIKYAKELGEQQMLSLAKDIAERRDVKNRGAYFMKVVKERRAATKKAAPSA